MFASLSASEGNSSEGIHMGISVLLGSSLFILAIVTALVVLASPRDIKLNKHFIQTRPRLDTTSINIQYQPDTPTILVRY